MNYEETPKKMWKYDVRTAKELHYPKEVIEMLEKEEDPRRRQRILHDARLGKYNW